MTQKPNGSPKTIAGLPVEEFIASGHRACAGCMQLNAIRLALKAGGKDTVLVQATGCGEVTTSAFPDNAWKIPYMHVAFENAAAVASGVEAAMRKQGKKINLLVFGGDGGTFDIGFQALSGAIERGHKFCYVCFDNGAYENTGIQRSSATPLFASTTTTPSGKKVHGKQEWAKNMPLIVATHDNGVYVATANIAYAQDFFMKVKKGLENDGPSYIQVFTPCPLGWGIPTYKGVEIATLAFQANITPLYEIKDGVLTFTRKPSKALPVENYLLVQKRFSGLTKDEIAKVQAKVDEEYAKLLKLEETKIRL